MFCVSDLFPNHLVKMALCCSISAITQAVDQMSTAVVYVLQPNMISGARYQRVITSTVRGLSVGVKVRAKPKSASFKYPSLVTRRFYGLISLCIIPRLWQYARPFSICVV